ncbi:MAG: FGGY family carbohydrate kinase [Rhizomicrobium sp.]
MLAIDQGTTSTRAILFDADARPVARHAVELRHIYPANGWVEHDAGEIWQAVLGCCRAALKGVPAAEVAAIGITNQRETTVLWDRRTGEPLYNAIVGQDRRTADRCRALKARKLEPKIAARTGLLLDPYFSGTKMEWLLDHVPGSRQRAQAGEVALGTVDAWLIYKLTGRARACDRCGPMRRVRCC